MRDAAETNKGNEADSGDNGGDMPRATAGEDIRARYACDTETAERIFNTKVFDVASVSGAVTVTADSGEMPKAGRDRAHGIAAHRLTTIKQSGRIRIA